MHSILSASVLASLATSAAATGILLPLYIYPSTTFGDGAANWKPATNAISNSSNQWLVVVNPDSGPGATGNPGNDDQNYIDGTSQLNGFGNVQTIGYVRTDYADSPMEDLKANITNYASWSSYTDADIGIKGIFFDEAADNYDYLNEAITFTRSAFSENVTTICNFGTKAPAEYYDICDVVIAFESYLNFPGATQYKDQETLDSEIEDGLESQAAVIVHDFKGTAYDGTPADVSLLQSYVSTIKADGVGWFYFCSANYDSITADPATVGANADALTAA